MYLLERMFEWFSSWLEPHHSGIVYPPYSAPVEPKGLEYETARVLLHRHPDVPYNNSYWDYPLKVPKGPEIEYSERMSHLPLFSSKHQIVDGQCLGKLHFTKSLHPNFLGVDDRDRAVLVQDGRYVISSDLPKQEKCASIPTGGRVPVEYRIGGSGPGGPEMSFRSDLTSTEYQRHGPHYIGRQLRDGSYCIEPAAMEMRRSSVITIDKESTKESIIKTS
jgi:hypothetical protein